MDETTALLVSAAFAILAALLALTALLGAAVAIKPDLLPRLRAATDRRYSMRRATRSLDVPRNIDRILYRHHRLYGTLVVALALFLLYFLAFGEQRPFWRELFPPDYREAASIVGDVARLVLWVFTVFALMVGTIVFVRPSALKRLESKVNRWVTARRATYDLDREYGWLDERRGRRPRLWGTVTLALSLTCLIALLVQWQASGLAG
jgi:hypothetical protein